MSYQQYKTPFFKIEIGSSTAKKKEDFTEIPYQVARLVEKVDIKEFFNQGCTAGQFSITFNEGSREPFPVDSAVDTSSAYPLNSNGSGALTNRPGMLADLQMNTQGGNINLTSIFPSESGVILDDLPASTDELITLADELGLASANSPELIIEDKKKAENKAVKFLFQQRNKVKVTWGYVEDLQSRRTIIGAIGMVQFDYPDGDNPKVIVTCPDLGAFFDQISGIFGASFYNKIPAGVTPFGDLTYNIQDASLTDFIKQFSDSANMGEPIVSEAFDNILLDKHAIKNIPAGMSANQYFQELAKKYNAFYKATFSPTTGEERIVFLDKAEYNKSLFLEGENLMKYKTPGSIIKSVSLKAEFNVSNGNAQTGVTDAGKAVGVATNSSVQVGIVGSEAQLLDTDPTAGNPIGAAKGAANALKTAIPIGTSNYHPGANNKETMKLQAASRADCQAGNAVMVNLTTLGHAKLRPGPIKIGGLGQRFSGTYYFWEVHHNIEVGTGYTCTLAGSSNSDYGGNGKAPESQKKTDEEEKVTVGVFGSVLGPFPGSTGAEVYNQDQGS
jgi:hypothetical protein